MKQEIKTIRQGESNFHITDGMVMYPRAMLHVLPECPRVYKDALQMAMEGGYIKLVAHVPGKQLTWEKLNDC